MNGVHAVLPPAWRGRSRAAAWRRARARRVLSACLLLVAGVLGWSALQGPAAASQPVTVAARDLPAGHRVVAADLQVVKWPIGVTLPNAVAEQAARGSVTTAAISTGEPLTGSRLRTGRNWPGVGSGHVVVSVPVTDPAVATLVGAGDRIDVLGPESALGSNLPVLMVTVAGKSGEGGPSTVWVSAPDAVAGRVAAATAASKTAGTQLSVVIRPAG